MCITDHGRPAVFLVCQMTGLACIRQAYFIVVKLMDTYLTWSLCLSGVFILLQNKNLRKLKQKLQIFYLSLPIFDLQSLLVHYDIAIESAESG